MDQDMDYAIESGKVDGKELFAPNPADLGSLNKSGRSYYDILEVSRDADRSEIRRAFIRMKNSLDKSQGAAYSLLDPSDKNASLKELEEAYRHLDDDYLRKKYNQERWGGEPTGSGRSHESYERASDDADSFYHRPYHVIRKSAEHCHDPSVQETLRTLVAEAESYNGALLKALRESVGVAQKEVQNFLKISDFLIDALEEDVYDDLPPLVYVRGFIKSYLDYLGVEDGRRIIDGYSGNLAEWKKKQVKKK